MSDELLELVGCLPMLPKGVEREVYVRAAGAEIIAALEAKRYIVVDLMVLPNKSKDERRDYLSKLAQAMTDGTVFMTSEDRRRIELEMKSLGLLDSKVVHETRAVKTGQTLEELLGWEDSRNTLAGNSTVVSANDLAKKAKGLAS